MPRRDHSTCTPTMVSKTQRSFSGRAELINFNLQREPVMTSKPAISAVIATFADYRHAGHFMAELQRVGFGDARIYHLPEQFSHEGFAAMHASVRAEAWTGGMLSHSSRKPK